MYRALFVLVLGLFIGAMPAASFAQSEDTPVADAGSVYCPQLSQTIVRGARDRSTVPPGQVTEFQKFVSDYYDIDPDDIVTGYFGPLTHRHAIRFQREQGLPAFGIVGPLTRAAIARVCGNSAAPTAQSCQFNGQTIADGASITAYAASTVPSDGRCNSETRTCINGVLTGSYTERSCSVGNAGAAQDDACSFNGQTLASGSSVVAYQASSVPPGGTCVSERRYCIFGFFTGSYAHATCTVGSNVTEPPRSCTQDGVTIAHGASRIFYNSRTVNSAGGCTAASEQRICTDGTLSGSFSYASCTASDPIPPTTGSDALPVISFVATQTSVAPGQQTILTWSATNATWCSAGGGWSGAKTTSGTETIAALWRTTTFTLSCFSTKSLGWTTETATVSVIPEEPPQTCSFNGQTIADGASITAYAASTVPSDGRCNSETRTCTRGVLSGSYAYNSCTVSADAIGPTTDRKCTPNMASTWNAVPSSGTAPLSITVTFYASSYYPWDSIDFGDGTKWAVPVPTNGESIYNSQGYACVRHTYVTPGMYMIWHTYGGNHVGGNIYQPNPTITVY